MPWAGASTPCGWRGWCSSQVTLCSRTASRSCWGHPSTRPGSCRSGPRRWSPGSRGRNSTRGGGRGKRGARARNGIRTSTSPTCHPQLLHASGSPARVEPLDGAKRPTCAWTAETLVRLVVGPEERHSAVAPRRTRRRCARSSRRSRCANGCRDSRCGGMRRTIHPHESWERRPDRDDINLQRGTGAGKHHIHRVQGWTDSRLSRQSRHDPRRLPHLAVGRRGSQGHWCAGRDAVVVVSRGSNPIRAGRPTLLHPARRLVSVVRGLARQLAGIADEVAAR